VGREKPPPCSPQGGCGCGENFLARKLAAAQQQQLPRLSRLKGIEQLTSNIPSGSLGRRPSGVRAPGGGAVVGYIGDWLPRLAACHMGPGPAAQAAAPARRRQPPAEALCFVLVLVCFVFLVSYYSHFRGFAVVMATRYSRLATGDGGRAANREQHERVASSG
jgi:hypothetical protein